MKCLFNSLERGYQSCYFHASFYIVDKLLWLHRQKFLCAISGLAERMHLVLHAIQEWSQNT